jgi:SAM-dependent methyltransferase
MSMLRSLLAHPLTRGLDVDSPTTTHVRRRIVREKGFLRRIYEEWYGLVRAELPNVPGPVLELGSGAGFMDEFIDGLITSEIFATPGASMVLDGTKLPFGASSLRAIAMTDVFHHIPAARGFLSEAARCLRPGGRIVMVEPWVNAWSRFVYTRFHHEPFLPHAEQWEFPSSGPLSGANGALPWIVFERDREAFAREFPELEVLVIRPFMPVAYLLSGGVGMRSLIPRFAYGACRAIEQSIPGMEASTAMFSLIVVQRRR